MVGYKKKGYFLTLVSVSISFCVIVYLSTTKPDLEHLIGPHPPFIRRHGLSRENRKSTVVGKTSATTSNGTEMKSCTPKEKFVFIKTHKTGSSTTIRILRRYAITNNLKILKPAGPSVFLSYPCLPDDNDILQYEKDGYDALMSHVVYNKAWLIKKFPTGAAYLTIIRNPFSHLKSSMNFYSIDKLLGINTENPVKTFLQYPWKYEEKSTIHFNFCNVIWNPTRNFQSYDLGYTTSGSNDKAQKYLRELDSDMTLVMLLEYLDESLLLLKRLMCWKITDILYLPVNYMARNYSYKHYRATTRETINHRQWSSVDYMLYDVFNKSLWEKIQKEGNDFFEELNYFRHINTKVALYCSRMTIGTNLTVEESRWESKLIIDGAFCSRIQGKDKNLQKRKESTSLRKTTKSTGGKRKMRVESMKAHMQHLIHGLPLSKYKKT